MPHPSVKGEVERGERKRRGDREIHGRETERDERYQAVGIDSFDRVKLSFFLPIDLLLSHRHLILDLT